MVGGTLLLVPLLPSTLTHYIWTGGQYRKGLSDASQIVRAADDRDWCSNVDPPEKHGSEISRHPHASVGRGMLVTVWRWRESTAPLQTLEV